MAMNFPEIESQGSTKSFVKVGDGNSVIGVFKGDPEIFYQVFENGKYKVVPKSDASGVFRFSINFITKEDGKLVAKLFQGNWHDLKALKALHDEFNLEETYVKVSQTGERQNKRMSFMPMTKQKPDQALFKAVELQDAKPRSNQAANVGYSNSAGYDSPPLPAFDEIPF